MIGSGNAAGRVLRPEATWCPGVLALVWILVLAPASAAGDDLESALAAARRGDFAEAYCVWKPMAMAGHAPSQYHLGWMYANGEGLAVNEEVALQWWRAAAIQGHTEAQTRLGMAYLYGEGVREDHAEALRWFLAVARKGDEDAQALVRRLAVDGDEAALSLVRELLADGWEVLGNGRRIRVDRAHVRSGPGTHFKVVSVVSRGQQLVEFRRSGKWVQIGLVGDPAIAWVHGSLIEESDGQAPNAAH